MSKESSSLPVYLSLVVGLLLVFVLLSGTVSYASTNDEELEEPQNETYENDDLGFTIQHPSDWEVSEAGNISSVREEDVLRPWESVIVDVTITAPQTVIEGVNDENLCPQHSYQYRFLNLNKKNT